MLRQSMLRSFLTPGTMPTVRHYHHLAHYAFHVCPRAGLHHTTGSKRVKEARTVACRAELRRKQGRPNDHNENAEDSKLSSFNIFAISVMWALGPVSQWILHCEAEEHEEVSTADGEEKLVAKREDYAVPGFI